MPDPKKQDPDIQPSTSPGNPYRKAHTKPVGRDSDATPGNGTEPTRTKAGEGEHPAPTPRDWSATASEKQAEAGGAAPDPFKIG